MKWWRGHRAFPGKSFQPSVPTGSVCMCGVCVHGQAGWGDGVVPPYRTLIPLNSLGHAEATQSPNKAPTAPWVPTAPRIPTVQRAQQRQPGLGLHHHGLGRYAGVRGWRGVRSAHAALHPVPCENSDIPVMNDGDPQASLCGACPLVQPLHFTRRRGHYLCQPYAHGRRGLRLKDGDTAVSLQVSPVSFARARAWER
jgi:hypothetical protein